MAEFHRYETDGEEHEFDLSSTYLTFELGSQMFGIDVRYVREVLDCQAITRIPKSPMDVLGIVDVRGTSVPIVDVEAQLGARGVQNCGDARIVVLEFDWGGEVSPLAIQADRVRNVEQIRPDEIEQVPTRGLGAWDASALSGLYRRGSDLVVLINANRMFSRTSIELDISGDVGFF